MKDDLGNVKVDFGNSSSLCRDSEDAELDNCTRYYFWLKIASARSLVSKEEDVRKVNSTIEPEYRDLIVQMINIPGVRYIWVYPYALYVRKEVIADWTDKLEGTGVHDNIYGLLKEALKVAFPNSPLRIKWMAGNEPLV